MAATGFPCAQGDCYKAEIKEKVRNSSPEPASCVGRMRWTENEGASATTLLAHDVGG
jgi:hypothetical protein